MRGPFVTWLRSTKLQREFCKAGKPASKLKPDLEAEKQKMCAMLRASLFALWGLGGYLGSDSYPERQQSSVRVRVSAQLVWFPNPLAAGSQMETMSSARAAQKARKHWPRFKDRFNGWK